MAENARVCCIRLASQLRQTVARGADSSQRASVHILQVGELGLVFEASRWAFAERQAASIAAHWARLRKARPLLFDGRVLLLSRRAIETRFDGMLTLKGVYLPG